MKLNRSCAALMALLVACTTHAAPFAPPRDDVVVETLPLRPSDPVMRRLQVLHVQLAQQPNNLVVALELARRYVELGRVTGDPRYAGYAQAALLPWWNLRSPPRDVLVLRAILYQRAHRFDDSLADLKLALERNPRDAQAVLTRATLLQVRGDFPAALRDCEALQGLAQPLVSIACVAAADSNTGRLRNAYAMLRAAAASQPVVDVSLRAWLLTGLAEMATRAGLYADAEAHFKAAMSADPNDQYLLAAYADYLLDRGRAREAAALVKDRTQADGLLLRYALALAQQRLPEAPSRIAELRARFAASRMRGDRVHLREEARFTLHLENDARAALALAKENWGVQKEPADVRVLFEAARAADDPAALGEVTRWIETTHLEDVHLQIPHPA